MNDGKKIKNNLLAGIVGQVCSVILAVLFSNAVLQYYGSEINGLLSSVTNIYAYIAIVEAGVAAASCQGLYKALTERNFDRANSILSATNKYYHRTGLSYLVLIIVFAAIYPLMISTDIPYGTIVLVILFNGLGNVTNYFFHGKYMIFLKADGKNYVRTSIETYINIAKQLAKIILIKLGYNVVFVQLVAMLTSVVQMIYITYYINKHYKWINLKCKPDMSVVQQSKHVLVHEINYLLSANVDVVLLTIFSTLKTVSVYSLYSMIYGTINKVLYTIREALEFKIAAIYHTDKNMFRKTYQSFEVYYVALAFSLFSITTYFVIPFLSLYTKGVTDVDYLQVHLPALFALINLLASGRHPLDIMVQISGHFKKTQKSSIIESSINLFSSLILIQFWGITGALVGSIASLLYRLIYLIHYVNQNIIERSVLKSYKCWMISACVFLVILIVNQFIQPSLDSYVKIFAFCVPYAIGNVLVFFGVASILEPEAFRNLREVLDMLIKKRTV